jgi:hypothetical protein
LSHDIALPDLEGALPPKPQNLFQLQRLCLRIHGMLTRDLKTQAAKLAQAVGHGLRKKARQDLNQTLAEDLPVILALHALDRLAADPRFKNDPNLLELLRGLLLPCFSLSYLHLYDQMQDPLKHVLARLDWYLDGDKGEPLSAFTHLVATILGDQLHDPAPLIRHLTDNLLPEIDKRLELAFRYEFA